MDRKNVHLWLSVRILHCPVVLLSVVSQAWPLGSHLVNDSNARASRAHGSDHGLKRATASKFKGAIKSYEEWPVRLNVVGSV